MWSKSHESYQWKWSGFYVLHGYYASSEHLLKDLIVSCLYVPRSSVQMFDLFYFLQLSALVCSTEAFQVIITIFAKGLMYHDEFMYDEWCSTNCVNK